MKERLEGALAQLPIAQYAFFSTQELEFSQRIRQVCRQECPRYGKSWACPPGVGTVEQCRERCLTYPRGLMLCSLAEVPHISDMAACLATRSAHEELTHRVMELMAQQGAELMALSTESCALCGECSYPNGACRQPEKMLPCVESHGIVLTALAEKYDLALNWGEQIVPWFSLILYR